MLRLWLQPLTNRFRRGLPVSLLIAEGLFLAAMILGGVFAGQTQGARSGVAVVLVLVASVVRAVLRWISEANQFVDGAKTEAKRTEREARS